jgi:hypothetical protein
MKIKILRDFTLAGTQKKEKKKRETDRHNPLSAHFPLGVFFFLKLRL